MRQVLIDCAEVARLLHEQAKTKEGLARDNLFALAREIHEIARRELAKDTAAD